MSTLFRHIEYLLLRHDCVMVPGLGAFVATVTPASIDLERGVVTPPVRNVMFNRSIRLDDGLLANSVAREAGISFADARAVILKEVNTMTAALENSGRIDCGRLGKLTRNDEGNLLYTPTLSPLGNIFKKVSLSANKANNAKNVKIANNANTVLTDRNFKIRSAVTRIAAACVLGAMIAMAVIFKPKAPDTREDRASVIPVEVLLPTPKATETVEPAQEAPAMEEETPAVAPVQTPRHYLIVGTFSSAAEAEKFVKANSTDQYPLTAVASRRVCRVSVESSDNRDELRKRLNSRDITTRFPNAWIWTRE